MRCFVGLPLPEAYQQGLEELSGALARLLRSRIAWTRPGNWHLTLAFLGEVAEARVADLRRALEGVHFSAFELQAGGAGFFPDARRPGVLWLGLVRGSAESAALARDVGRTLEPLGFAPDPRPFAAHLTLGRVRERRPDDWAAAAREMEKRSWPPVAVDRFVFWQSVLGDRGPRYQALAGFGAAR